MTAMKRPRRVGLDASGTIFYASLSSGRKQDAARTGLGVSSFALTFLYLLPSRTSTKAFYYWVSRKVPSIVSALKAEDVEL